MRQLFKTGGSQYERVLLTPHLGSLKTGPVLWILIYVGRFHHTMFLELSALKTVFVLTLGVLRALRPFSIHETEEQSTQGTAEGDILIQCSHPSLQRQAHRSSREQQNNTHTKKREISDLGLSMKVLTWFVPRIVGLGKPRTVHSIRYECHATRGFPFGKQPDNLLSIFDT